MPSEAWPVLLCVLGAYLWGAVPFGLLIGLARGVDVRKVGSGNIGATNVGRALGRPYGLLVFGLDFVKGFVPVLVARVVVLGVGRPWDLQESGAVGYVIWVAVAAAAILGHMFSVYLGFKGGKGVATSLGAVLAIYPYLTVPGLLAFAVWIVVTRASGIVSVGSITAAFVFPIFFALLVRYRGWGSWDALWPMYVFVVLMAGLVIYRHRDNVQWLLRQRQARIEAAQKNVRGEK